MFPKKKILIIGPTGVGKTGLSLELAQALKCPIISVDSRQCYNYLDIGTAKPSLKELTQVQHFNVSVLDPKEKESAGKFLERVEGFELKHFETALFVGGSTLHIQSLLFGLNTALPKANEERVTRLNELAKTHPHHLIDLLHSIDPEYAARTEGFNPQRIVRAIDVWMQTGEKFSSFHKSDFDRPDPSFLVIGLTRERQLLYRRAENRVEQMIKDGLVEEISGLLSKGYSFDDPGMSSVGYKEFYAFFNGDKSLKNVEDTIKTSTRRYIKRQLTWFKRWPFVHWYHLDSLSHDVLLKQVEKKITNFLQN